MTREKFIELTKGLDWDRSISDTSWCLDGIVGRVWLSPERVEVVYASKDGYSHDCTQISLKDVTNIEISRGYLRIGIGGSTINIKI